MPLNELLKHTLPLNRKEQFYTGTVFPMIVCKDNFKHLGLLLSMLGISNLSIEPDDLTDNILFFTEYSLVESIRGDSEGRFHGLPVSKETPDIVILIDTSPRILIVFEAKMYDTPSQKKLETQMAAQQKILNSIQAALDIEDKNVHHRALLPEALQQHVQFPPERVITWESICEEYQSVCKGDYYFKLLQISLEMYDALVSKKAGSGKNCEEKIPGQNIYDRFKQRELDKISMGREGGLYGKVLKQDIESGQWRRYSYETSSIRADKINPKWFSIGDFVKRIDSK